MISVKEALELSLSEKFNPVEQRAYDVIITKIDQEIRERFNGKSVSIITDGFWADGATYKLEYKVSKYWRRDIINNKWKREYRNLGWNILEEAKKDGYGSIIGYSYTFSVDPSYNRDEKLNKLLGS